MGARSLRVVGWNVLPNPGGQAKKQLSRLDAWGATVLGQE